MEKISNKASIWLGLCLIIGLGVLGFIEYSFTKLNDIKPDMIEEATKNAREVAQKFAKDSQSSLGKIKRATQGQFSIYDRDSNTPYIKKVRVVSTVQYYLSD
ncbi:TPA: SIMPL domain-containing protein [Vibrio parahaemolyticus]|nr:SIMPL domain-containing protein [Vibrio parahaemolyticus]